MSEWEDLEPIIWQPTREEETIQGIYVKLEPNKGKYGNTLYHIETENGEVLVFGNSVLDDRMVLATVGDVVKITYKGKRPCKQGEVNIYKVQRQKAKNSIPPDTDLVDVI